MTYLPDSNSLPDHAHPGIQKTSALAEILGSAPRPLIQVQAELLFVDDEILYHSRVGEKHVYKYLRPEQLQAATNQLGIDSGWLPEHTVRWGNNGVPWVVQFFPPTRYRLRFTIDSQFRPDDKEIGEVSLQIPLPGLVLFCSKSDAYAWAVKSKKFSPQSEAYLVPLPNIEWNGKLCLGENRTAPFQKGIDANLIWNSWKAGIFGDHMKSRKSKRFPQDIRHLLWELHSKTRSVYPTNDLQSANTSLQAAIYRLIKST